MHSDLNLGSAEWIEIQGKLLSGALTRIELSDLMHNVLKEDQQDITDVRIWRNFAAEPMENAFRLLGLYWGLHYKLEFMGYDDSFSFNEYSDLGSLASIEIILIDKVHYKIPNIKFYEWIKVREDNLSVLTGNVVITVILEEQIVVRFDGIEVTRLIREIGVETFYDPRYEAVTGSRLTPKTHFLIARELATAWVGSVIAAPKKLIVVDLDFTLHEGVLGELQGDIKVTKSYLKLQEQLLAAKRRGFMLAIISKNDLRDVFGLLGSLSAYILNEEDFVAIEASWEAKHLAMSRILHKTRVNQDAAIFIDDNPVELLQMKTVFPNISIVSAADGPDSASQSLLYVPGYQRQRSDDLGETRIRDIQSNDERLILIQNGLSEYYQSANPVLKISIRDEMQLERLVDLSRRSNQFNLTLSRSELTEYCSTDSIWVGLGLSDHFSDSGIIGGLLLKKSDSEVCEISELFLSCRVLGRGLENALICQGLLAGITELEAKKIVFSWKIGDRNEPALNWLASNFLKTIPDCSGSITILVSQVQDLAVPPQGVKVEVSN